MSEISNERIVFTCVWKCVHVCKEVYIVHVYVGQRTALGIIPGKPSIHFEAGPLTGLEFSKQGRLLSQLAPETPSASPGLGLHTHNTCHVILSWGSSRPALWCLSDLPCPLLLIPRKFSHHTF